MGSAGGGGTVVRGSVVVGDRFDTVVVDELGEMVVVVYPSMTGQDESLW